MSFCAFETIHKIKHFNKIVVVDAKINLGEKKSCVAKSMCCEITTYRCIHYAIVCSNLCFCNELNLEKLSTQTLTSLLDRNHSIFIAFVLSAPIFLLFSFYFIRYSTLFGFVTLNGHTTFSFSSFLNFFLLLQLLVLLL